MRVLLLGRQGRQQQLVQHPHYLATCMGEKQIPEVTIVAPPDLKSGQANYAELRYYSLTCDEHQSLDCTAAA